MKNLHFAKQIKTYLVAILCLCTITSCISDGDETVVLETGNAKAQKMLLGKWQLSSKTIINEDGEDVSKEDISKEPTIEFVEDGKCTLQYPDEKEVIEKWSLSDDQNYLFISNAQYTIYTLGKNILVLIVRHDNYYLKYIYYKLSTPGSEDSDDNETGGIADKNPYEPSSSEVIVDKIVVEGDTYTFEYDDRGRIMKYNTPEKTYTFTYDDTKVYLKLQGKIVNTGLIGANKYLSTIWNGSDASKGVSTITYNTNKYLSRLEYNATGTNISWSPSYSNGNMTSRTGDQSHTFTYATNYNSFGIDLNGFISSMYQWEWFMHDAEIIWGLFDFFGKRSFALVKQETTAQWTNTFTYEHDTKSKVLWIVQIRKGLNTNFDRSYAVYYHIRGSK